MSGIYPNSFYRVGVKALIKNEEGKILLVKEDSNYWDLPGGGLDHGEDPKDGLKRELREEISINSNIEVGNIIEIKPFWLEDRQAWLMWVVYEVRIPEHAIISPGEGVSAVEYINPRKFQFSLDELEKHLSTYGD